MNGGNSMSMDSQQLIGDAKIEIEKRTLELNNLMDQTRKNYIALLNDQWSIIIFD